MQCTKTYTINGKRITVAWGKLAFAAVAVVTFIVCEQIWGPF